MGVSINTFLKNIKYKDTTIKLIFVNVVVFVLLSVVNLFAKLFQVNVPDLTAYIGVSSDVNIMITRIWTVLTYMFVHYDMWHILFNMLLLYWFGRIFLMYFTAKNLVAMYLLGGLAGSIFYLITFNTIPYFIAQGESYMIGASASVMAIIFASAFYNRNLEVGLLLIGRVKIIYVALFMFAIDFVAIGSGTSNLGGHISHIGGAAIGYLFAIRFLKGKDMTKGFNFCLDKVVNLFKPKPKLRVTFNRSETDQEYNRRKYNEDERIDLILDKIKKSGYESLTDKEKKQLFDASNK